MAGGSLLVEGRWHVRISETISGPNDRRIRPGSASGPGSEAGEMSIGSMRIEVIVAGGLLVASLTPAAAQFPDLRSLFAPNSSTATIPTQSSVPGSAAWSGEAGASGHPLMTREAILAAAANFSRCIEGMWPEAARRGVSRESFEQHTAGLTPDLRIMDLLDSQPEFTKTFWDYLDLLVNDERIQTG